MMAAMSIDHDALARSVARLERVDLADAGLDAALELVVAETDDLFEVDGAGLLLIDGDGVLRYTAASDEPGRMLEALQEQFSEGPCVDAFLEDEPVLAGDLRTDPRWPSVGPLAAGHGVRSVLGIPIDLQHALDHRSLIEQAKGVIMAQRRCDADTAFDVLITASQRENVKLRLVAQRVVDGVTKHEV